MVGLGIGTADDHTFATPAVAVAGCSAGVLWAHATPRWPWPTHLVVEIGLLAALAAGWASDRQPPRPDHLAAAAGHGRGRDEHQSVVAHRMHEATTYLTGTLTGALHDLVAGQRGHLRPGPTGRPDRERTAVAACCSERPAGRRRCATIGLLLLATLAYRPLKQSGP